MTGNSSIERLHTGIRGFDEVALGGLPAGRPTLVSGTTGSGKTLFAAEFLARGILNSGQAGVFVTFEEPPESIRHNFASLGFPISEWEAEGKWAFVDVSASIGDESPVVGGYDFYALVARVEHAVRRTGASRVVLDSLGGVFTRFADISLVRQEVYRIVGTLRNLGVTSILTSERPAEYDGVSRYGVEEFVADNVIVLRNVLRQERRRRTVEIVKFRGAMHRTGEWLFTIDPHDGLVVIPLAFIPPSALPATHSRVSSGNAELDEMCGGGFYKDAIVLITGTTGAGKTLAGLKFIAAGIEAGERCLTVSFEESHEQMRRNAAGWGLAFDSWETSGMLQVISEYPESASLENHFVRIRRVIEEIKPSRLVIDTVSALERIVSPRALLDFFIALGATVRQHAITTLLTSTPSSRYTPRVTPSIAGEIASLTDVTIAFRFHEHEGEIVRALTVLQTRGSEHDPGIRRVRIDSDGMHIGDRITSAGYMDDATLPSRIDTDLYLRPGGP